MLTHTATSRVFILILGAASGPLVQLMATPLLARLYLPSDFGDLALFLSAAGVLVSVSCLRYEVAIAVVDDEDVPASIWVAVGSSLALFAVLVLMIGLHLPQSLFPQLDKLGGAIWGVPIFATCGGLVLVGTQITLRHARFWLNAALRSGQPIVFVLLAISFRELGLVNISLLSALAFGIILITLILKETPPVHFAEVRRVALRHKKYPVFLMPTSLVDALATSAPVFFISWAYGAVATGNYIQIQKLVGAPLVLAAIVIGQLFLKHSAELHRSGRSSKNLLWKYVGYLSWIAGVVVFSVLTGGEYFFGLLLGSEWRVDTWFLLLATAPNLSRLIVSPVSSIFITHNRVGVAGSWQFAYFFSTVFVFYIAATNASFENFLIIYTLHETLLYSIYLYMANRVSGGILQKK